MMASTVKAGRGHLVRGGEMRIDMSGLPGLRERCNASCGCTRLLTGMCIPWAYRQVPLLHPWQEISAGTD